MKETWDNNCIIPLYDNANQVCGIIHNGSAYYFLKNLQGDVIAITDDAGNTVARYKYDAWGECTIEWANCAIGVINPFRYRSYYYDNETGFYYLNSRYYDPKICRFINADDARYISSSDNNIYCYCCNDPVSYIDLLGFCCNKRKPVNVGILYMHQTKGSDQFPVLNLLKDSVTHYFKNKQVNILAESIEGLRYDTLIFYKKWTKVKFCDIIIIETHGEPKELTDDVGYECVNLGSCSSLGKSAAKLILLTGCNAGHFDIQNNIASKFSLLIDGCVVASDGTVKLVNKDIITFESMGDHKYWKPYTKALQYSDGSFYYNTSDHKRTKNYGWMIYKNGAQPSDYSLGKSITFKSLMDYLIQYGYVFL